MSSWYTEYLEYFDKPYALVPQTVIEEVRNNFARFQTTDPPVASVVIIARNEETRLFSCLWSLSKSCCDYPIEFIGVDNDSTDRTAEIYEAVGVTYYTEKQRSPGYARQCGLYHSHGKYYFGVDSDTLYPPHYIISMIKELEKPGIVGVSAMYNFIPDKNHSRSGLKLYQILRDIHIRMLSFKRVELCVRGSVWACRADYGKKIGYRVDIKRGEDGSMALELKKYGKIKIVLNRKTRSITATNSLSTEGNLFKNFKIRVKMHLKNFSTYFTKKSHYKDTETNLINSG